MAKHYLADSDRYALYGLDQPDMRRALDRIAARGHAFAREGVEDFLGRISQAPGVGQTYRDHRKAIADALTAHYEAIIGARFAEAHGASNRRTVARLFEIGTDMRALFACSAFVLDAFARRRIGGRWSGGGDASEEVSALQRLLICDDATSFTYEQQRIIAQNEQRQERLTAQLADFRAIVSQISSELGDATRSVGDAMRIVSDASGGALARSRAAADSTHHGNRNLTSSAASTEELAQSINELTRQSELSRDLATRVADAVRGAHTAIEDLQGSAGKIGSIVDLISRVAEQTNLLSLNATIEAARAGEAGRGFAVVAQEVKALSGQTTRATQEIVEQIAAVQNGASRSAAEIVGIGAAMQEMSRSAAEVATAIGQQNSLTAELSRNLHDTVGQVLSASDGYNAAATMIASASDGADRLRDAVATLSRIGSDLIGDVDAFSARIKAA